LRGRRPAPAQVGRTYPEIGASGGRGRPDARSTGACAHPNRQRAPQVSCGVRASP
jgi:hypothetical protein